MSNIKLLGILFFRRPILLIFFGISFGIFIPFYFDLSLEKALLLELPILLLAILFLILTRFHKTIGKSKNLFYYISLILILLYIFSMYSSYLLNKADNLSKYKGKEINISGKILSIEKFEEDYSKYYIKVNDNKYLLTIIGKIFLKKNYMIGKYFSLKGNIEVPKKNSNPNLFNYNLYLKTEKIYLIINAKSNDIEFYDKSFFEDPIAKISNIISSFKYNFLNELNKYLKNDNFEILKGIMFGDKKGISEETNDAFSKNGASHILAVSGLHIGLIYAFISLLFSRRWTLLKSICIISFLIFYAFLAEFSIPVIRAILIIFIHILGHIIKRDFDFLAAISFAGVLMFIYNPLTLFSASFLLSYTAVFTIAFTLPIINRITNNKFLRTVFLVFAIQIGMMGIIAFLFNYFSISAFFINFLVIFLAGIILPFGLLLLILYFFKISILFEFFSLSENTVISFMKNVLSLSSNISFLSFNIVSPPFLFLLFYYFILFFICSDFFFIIFKKKKKNFGIIIGVFIVVIFLSFSTVNTFKKDNSDIVFIDVGQGDGIHIRTPNGKNILIDGGGKKDYNLGKNLLKPYLLKNGVSKIDYAIVTHLHDDHFKALKELSNEMEIKNFITYYDNKKNINSIIFKTGLETSNKIFVYKGQILNIEKDFQIEILHPDKNNSDENDDDENKNSIIFNLIYKGKKILMTGDMGFEGEKEILASYAYNPALLKTDILKIGHHGSKNSTSDQFLKTVNPSVAMIQVGKNNYGHPTAEVLNKLKLSKIKTFRNDEDGAVMINIDSSQLIISSI
ncbi:MAG: DNA internalization-related competence protein ComEC/Rec2, partial [Clostridiales Family XIII bacterium]|nr:DNA internalization-related competence protein ComEC/Rec2 [Clostridiales Family XIII bacterium]